jgi:hypothetical protein
VLISNKFWMGGEGGGEQSEGEKRGGRVEGGGNSWMGTSEGDGGEGGELEGEGWRGGFGGIKLLYAPEPPE